VGSEVRRFRGRKKRVLVFSFFQFRTIGRLVLNLDLVTLSQKKKTAKVCELYPSLEETGAIDDIMPKKEQGNIAKW
jgi:hypothetical protein